MHANFPTRQISFNIDFWVLIFWVLIFWGSYFVILVQQKPTKRPTLQKASATLHATTKACFNSL